MWWWTFRLYKNKLCLGWLSNWLACQVRLLSIQLIVAKRFYPVTVCHILVGMRVFPVLCTVFALWLCYDYTLVKRGCEWIVGTTRCVICLLKVAAMLVWLFVVLFGKLNCKLVHMLNYGQWHGDVYMIYLIAIGLTPSGSSTVHIYTQTIHRTTQWNRIHRTEHT
jgi:hypothetical protein